MLKVISRGSL